MPRLDKVLETDASGGRALIKGIDTDGRPVEIELTLNALTALMPALAACEADLLGEAKGKQYGPVFFYGVAMVMKCLSARPDRPGQNMGFRLALTDLGALGGFCSRNAKRMSKQSAGHRPG